MINPTATIELTAIELVLWMAAAIATGMLTDGSTGHAFMAAAFP
jgi:hypothetical protein